MRSALLGGGVGHPANVWFTVSGDIVQSSHDGIVGGVSEEVRIALRFVSHFDHDLAEAVEGAKRLGFGRFDHEAVHYGPAHRWWVNSMIYQPLGEITFGYSHTLKIGHGDEFVGVGAGNGQGVVLFDLGGNVVGIEDRLFGSAAQSITAEGAKVGVGADDYAYLSIERADFADAFGNIVIEIEVAGIISNNVRAWKVGAKFVTYSNRACSRPSASVRGAEGLVRIKVHHIDSDIAGANDTHSGVHVCPVVVE